MDVLDKAILGLINDEVSFKDLIPELTDFFINLQTRPTIFDRVVLERKICAISNILQNEDEASKFDTNWTKLIWEVRERIEVGDFDFLFKACDLLSLWLFGQSKNFWADMDYLGSTDNLSIRGKSEQHNNKDRIQKEEGHFHYVPYSYLPFLEILEKIYRRYGKRKGFVDVGAGIGDKVFLAWMSKVFKYNFGVEYEKFTSYVGRFAFKHIKWHDSEKTIYSRPDRVPVIFTKNAFDFDFGNADTAYFFCPIASSDLFKLYLHVFKTLPVGGIIVEVSKTREYKEAFMKLVKNPPMDCDLWATEWIIEKVDDKTAKAVKI